MSDSSNDSAVTEQETIYVLFISEGTPVFKYLSIKNAKNADVPDYKSTLEIVFNRFGITHFCDKLVGLNLDRASVSMGQYNGLNVLVQDEAPWAEVVHCFNHWLELAIKDAFIKSIFYLNINEVLSELYWLYQKSPKRLTQLKELSEAFEKSIPKPTKADGTRWIDFKFRAMEKISENYGLCTTHLEQLAHTDSQLKKREEIKGFVNKWKDTGYLMHIAIFIDI